MDPAPPTRLDPRFVPDLRALHEFAGELTSNALYMQNELGNLAAPPEVKERIADLCSALMGIAYDVRQETADLAYKLSLAHGEPSRDPDITNPDPRVTLEVIRALPEEVLFDQLDSLVRLLDPGSTGSPSSSFILVAESGTNMLRAHERAAKAMDRIEAMLPNDATVR